MGGVGGEKASDEGHVRKTGVAKVDRYQREGLRRDDEKGVGRRRSMRVMAKASDIEKSDGCAEIEYARS